MENLEIVPLSQDYLEEALRVVNNSFSSFSKDEDPNLWFPASLKPEDNRDLFEKNGASDVRYFLAIDKDTNKVVGTTGIYHLTDSENIAWLGWYCVDKSFRGRGIGKFILEWTIKKAKEEDNKALRLYTNLDEESKVANILYDRLGFRTYKTEGEDRQEMAYKELSL